MLESGVERKLRWQRAPVHEFVHILGERGAVATFASPQSRLDDRPRQLREHAKHQRRGASVGRQAANRPQKPGHRHRRQFDRRTQLPSERQDQRPTPRIRQPSRRLARSVVTRLSLNFVLFAVGAPFEKKSVSALSLKRPSTCFRNPVTGMGLNSIDEIAPHRLGSAASKDGNPLLGVGYDAKRVITDPVPSDRIHPAGKNTTIEFSKKSIMTQKYYIYVCKYVIAYKRLNGYNIIVTLGLVK